MEVHDPGFVESYIYTPVVSARAGPLSPVLRDLHGSSFLVLINVVLIQDPDLSLYGFKYRRER